MSKIVVNSLPYYGDECPIKEILELRKVECLECNCPMYWSKYYIDSDKNPRECEHLVELSKVLYTLRSCGEISSEIY